MFHAKFHSRPASILSRLASSLFVLTSSTLAACGGEESPDGGGSYDALPSGVGESDEQTGSGEWGCVIEDVGDVHLRNQWDFHGAPDASNLRVHEDSVFWTESTLREETSETYVTLFFAPLDGSTAPEVVAVSYDGFGGPAGDMVFDEETAYFTDGDGIQAFDFRSGTVTRVFEASAFCSARGGEIAHDAEHIYYPSAGGLFCDHESGILMIDKETFETEWLITGFPNPSAPLVLEGSLFFASIPDAAHRADGKFYEHQVVQVDIATGETIELGTIELLATSDLVPVRDGLAYVAPKDEDVYSPEIRILSYDGETSVVFGDDCRTIQNLQRYRDGLLFQDGAALYTVSLDGKRLVHHSAGHGLVTVKDDTILGLSDDEVVAVDLVSEN